MLRIVLVSAEVCFTRPLTSLLLSCSFRILCFLDPPVKFFFKEKAQFSGFEVKKQYFLIVEGLDPCSIIYQILIIFMACSGVLCTYINILPSSNSFKINDISKAPKIGFSCISQCLLIPVIFTMYIKSFITVCSILFVITKYMCLLAVLAVLLSVHNTKY